MIEKRRLVALIVEDVAEVAEIVSLYLRRLDVDSHHVGDVASAFTFLESEPIPDFIILDIGMPVVSGWEFLEKMRQNKAYDAIRVAILTAYTDADSRNRGQALQVDAYLKKPLIFDQLKELVKAFTERSEPE